MSSFLGQKIKRLSDNSSARMNLNKSSSKSTFDLKMHWILFVQWSQFGVILNLVSNFDHIYYLYCLNPICIFQQMK